MTTDSPSSPKHRCFKAIALLLFVFILGNLTGIGGSACVMLKHLQSTLRDPSIVNPRVENFLDRAASKIGDDLDLNATDRKAVREELETTGNRLGEIRLQMATDLKATARETIDRIEPRLSEEKRAAFRESAARHLAPWGIAK